MKQPLTKLQKILAEAIDKEFEQRIGKIAESSGHSIKRLSKSEHWNDPEWIKTKQRQSRKPS